MWGLHYLARKADMCVYAPSTVPSKSGMDEKDLSNNIADSKHRDPSSPFQQSPGMYVDCIVGVRLQSAVRNDTQLNLR